MKRLIKCDVKLSQCDWFDVWLSVHGIEDADIGPVKQTSTETSLGAKALLQRPPTTGSNKGVIHFSAQGAKTWWGSRFFVRFKITDQNEIKLIDSSWSQLIDFSWSQLKQINSEKLIVDQLISDLGSIWVNSVHTSMIRLPRNTIINV